MNIEFPFKKFEFQIVPQEPLILPSYKGSTLRGGFGNAFKRIVCAIRSKECTDCILKEKCVYSYVFETPPPSDTEIMRKYTSAPHLFIMFFNTQQSLLWGFLIIFPNVTQKFYAHSVNGRPTDEWQPLDEHLLNVAELALRFAEELGVGEWA